MQTPQKISNVRIISYFVIVLSVVGLLAFPLIFTMAKSMNFELGNFNFQHGLSAFLSIFGIISATLFLKKKKGGRGCLLTCCTLYLVENARGFISTYNYNGSYAAINILIVLMCAYSIWYLKGAEAKEWINNN